MLRPARRSKLIVCSSYKGKRGPNSNGSRPRPAGRHPRPIAAIHQRQIYAHRSARHDQEPQLLAHLGPPGCRTRPVSQSWKSRQGSGQLAIATMRVVYAFLPTALAFVGRGAVLPRAAPRQAADIASLDVSSLDPAMLGGVVAAVGAAAVLASARPRGTRRNSSEPPQRRDGGVPAQARAATARRAALPRRPRPRPRR